MLNLKKGDKAIIDEFIKNTDTKVAIFLSEMLYLKK